MKFSKLRFLSVCFLFLLIQVFLFSCGPAASNAAPLPTTLQKTISAASHPDSSVPSVPSAPSVSSIDHTLQVLGANLCDSQGSPIQLKGISTHGLHWFPQYVNKDAFRYFHDQWGANLIRLAMYTEEGGYLASSEQQQTLKQKIQQAIDDCSSLGMYCLIDWHILSDGNPRSHINEAKAFFSEMSTRYGKNPFVLYEICNEPNGGTTWSDIKSYAEELIPVIRAYAPNAIIVVGTPTWSQDVDRAAADPVRADLNHNVMYAFHFYAATHRDDLRKKVTDAHNAGLPIFITEFSTCDASGNGMVDTASADAWFRLIQDYKLSYAGWNLSNKAESSALLKSTTQDVSGHWSDQDFSETGLLLKSLMAKSH